MGLFVMQNEGEKMYNKKTKKNNKPNFRLSFSKEKLTPEQDKQLIAQYVFKLIEWAEKDLKAQSI